MFLRDCDPAIIVADFAKAEFASGVARQVRMRVTTAADAHGAFAALDVWLPKFARQVEIRADDVALAEAFLRRLDLPLRAPDAIHIAVARRLSAALATFDEKMAACARTLGVEVAAA